MKAEEEKRPIQEQPVSRDEEAAEEWARIIRQRNQWFYSLSVPRKQEKLFELEALLKGLDRFFNLANLPLSDRNNIVSRDFTNELRIIRNTVARVIKLIQGLLTKEDNQALHFRNYVETTLLNDYQRAKRIEKALRQRTPEESLYVLCYSFINFHEILQAVLGQKKNSYFLFHNVEQLISREIANNRFFNPFKAAGFAPHYDVVKSRRFSLVLRSVEDPALRKHLSILFLMMFKLLRYLSFIRTEKKSLEELKDSLLIFALVHSESMLLVDILERQMPGLISNHPRIPKDVKEKFLEHMDALAYQLSVELKKMFELELKDAALAKEVQPLRIGMIRSRGLLTNIFQQGIIHLGQVIDPELDGKEVFPDFVSRIEESLKLRRDVWLFHKVIENLEEVIEQSLEKGEVIQILEAMKTLRNFIFYYQNISFQFVRAYDRDGFQDFFDRVDRFSLADIDNREKLERFKKEIHVFKMFLKTTLANINNRAELQGIPFGTEEGEKILAQFLS